MKISALQSFLNKIFLVIPALLFTFALLFAPIIYDPGVQQEFSLGLWKTFWHISYYFYFISALGVFFLWFKTEKKSVITFLKAYRFLLGGLLLSMFSYALAGFVIDIAFVLYYLGSSIFGHSVK